MDQIQADEKDIRKNIRAFEGALESKPVSLTIPDLRRILLAIDGSNQDETSVRLAAKLARRTEALVMIIYAYEGPLDQARTDYLTAKAGELIGAGIRVEVFKRELPAPHGRRSFEQILEAADSYRADLIVVCAPYMEDFTELGRHSAGTNLDILMSRANVPLLVVREPQASSPESLRGILVPVSPYTSHTLEAAGWALRLLPNDGFLLLVGTVDREQLEHAGSLLSGYVSIHELDDEMLAGLYRPEVAGLIAELQRRAADAGFGCKVLVRAGSEVQTLAQLADQEGLTLVVGCPCEPTSPSFQRAQALVRESLRPMLVV